jgi:nucleoside-diphosphate-sugar epimerase
MESLRGEKILVTGPAGQIAFPLASRLAGDNEVWGIARFGNRQARERKWGRSAALSARPIVAGMSSSPRSEHGPIVTGSYVSGIP